MNDQDLLRDALEAEAEAQRALLAGDTATASARFLEAAEHYRRSWERAGKTAYGRLVGMLKATILGGGDVHEAAGYARRQVTDPASPTAWYVCGLAAAIRHDAGVMRNAASGMRPGGPAFGRAADVLAALAEMDVGAAHTAIQAIHADFAERDEHLTGVPIADTALMFERLAPPAP
jgi:hypothetical protein